MRACVPIADGKGLLNHCLRMVQAAEKQGLPVLVNTRVRCKEPMGLATMHQLMVMLQHEKGKLLDSAYSNVAESVTLPVSVLQLLYPTVCEGVLRVWALGAQRLKENRETRYIIPMQTSDDKWAFVGLTLTLASSTDTQGTIPANLTISKPLCGFNNLQKVLDAVRKNLESHNVAIADEYEQTVQCEPTMDGLFVLSEVLASINGLHNDMACGRVDGLLKRTAHALLQQAQQDAIKEHLAPCLDIMTASSPMKLKLC